MTADSLAERCGVQIARPEAQALTAHARLANEDVIIAKPQTFMNLSGRAVTKLLQKYELPPERMIVVVDDVDIPFGQLRLRGRGSAGSHNGLKSIIGGLQSDQFIRVRLGVGPEHQVSDRKDYVLGTFRKAALEKVAEMVDRAADAVESILRDGLAGAMNRYNAKA
jgi:PTH1 family peptidyl-tRNA hydrolase